MTGILSLNTLSSRHEFTFLHQSISSKTSPCLFYISNKLFTQHTQTMALVLFASCTHQGCFVVFHLSVRRSLFWSSLTSRDNTFHSTSKKLKLFITRRIFRLWSWSAQWKEYSPLDWCSAPPWQKATQLARCGDTDAPRALSPEPGRVHGSSRGVKNRDTATNLTRLFCVCIFLFVISLGGHDWTWRR